MTINLNEFGRNLISAADETLYYAAAVPYLGTGVAIFGRLLPAAACMIVYVALGILERLNIVEGNKSEKWYDYAVLNAKHGLIDLIPGVKLVVLVHIYAES